MVHSTDNAQAFLMLNLLNLQACFDFRFTAFDIQAGSLIRVALVANRCFDFIRNKFDTALRIMIDCSMHRTAMRMPHNNNQRCAQMTGSVFNTAQLMLINHITGNTDNKQFADAVIKIFSGITRESEQ